MDRRHYCPHEQDRSLPTAPSVKGPRSTASGSSRQHPEFKILAPMLIQPWPTEALPLVQRYDSSWQHEPAHSACKH
jgi:hypothetical protein